MKDKVYKRRGDCIAHKVRPEFERKEGETEEAFEARKKDKEENAVYAVTLPDGTRNYVDAKVFEALFYEVE
jgi:hypothetical protein